MPSPRDPSIVSAPAPSQRNRKPTARKQQLNNDIQAKETAKALSAKKSLLRARQSLAEANDYEGERDEAESEDDSDDDTFQAFTTVTVPKHPQPRVQSKPTLTRRVGSGKENQPIIAPSTISRLSMNTVQARGDAQSPVPQSSLRDPSQPRSEMAFRTLQSLLSRRSSFPVHVTQGDQADPQDELPTVSHMSIPPSVLGTRKAPPTPAAATTVVVKQKKTATGTRGRVRASQFDSLTKAILEDACGYYRCLIVTEFPYPNHTEDQEWAGEAWVTACKACGVEVEFDEDILKLIVARASQVRGELKTKARAVIEKLFDLDDTAEEDGKRAIRKKVETLLHRSSFIFRDPTKRAGIYRSSIITKVINKMWFAHPKDEGITYHSFFHPRIPLVTIALVLTAVENVLDEWQTGEHTEVHFSAALYRSKFEKQLANLEEFDARTKNAGIVPSMQKELARLARRNAKVPADVAAAGVSDLDDADFKAAMEEWDACATGGEDVEQGNGSDLD